MHSIIIFVGDMRLSVKQFNEMIGCKEAQRKLNIEWRGEGVRNFV